MCPASDAGSTRRVMRNPGRKLSRAEHIRHAYHHHFAQHHRERQFIASGGFFVTFAITRAITHAIKAGKAPFHDIGGKGGTHIHHMTFGITANLIVGYLWVLQIGTHRHRSLRLSRTTSLLYGAGAALTLDEFALWLNLEDDYWSEKGRESIDAVVLFGTLVSIGALGGGVLRKLARRLREDRHSGQLARMQVALRDRERLLRTRIVQNQ